MFESSGSGSVANCALPRLDVSGIDLPVLQGLADEAGCADAIAVFAALTALDPAVLVEDHDVVELIAGLAQLRTWLEAHEEAVLLTFARRNHVTTAADPTSVVLSGQPGEVTRPFLAEELAPRLGVGPRTVQNRLALASQLLTRFPAAHARRREGVLCTAKAAILVRECTELDPAACAHIEEKVLGRAEAQSPVQFTRTVRKLIASHDPDGAQARHHAAVARRYVAISPAADGMAWLTAYLPAPDAVMIHTALTAAAHRAHTETGSTESGSTESRTTDQLRADLLTWPFHQALLTGILTGPTEQHLGRTAGAKPQIHITAPITMLMGLSDDPAHLRGYGPIPASMARAIAAQGTWRRLLTDPATGTVLDVGTTTYTPPADLIRHIHARDQHCRYPGCTRPANQSDIDHVVPFPHGPTANTNLVALCRRHHRYKHHHPSVHLEHPEPGTLNWRMPTGHTYTVTPEPPC